MARGQVIEYGRFLEAQAPSDCMICGEHVDRNHPRSGTFGLTQKLAPQLPVHLNCLNGWETANVLARYNRILMDGGGFADKPLPMRRELVH